MPFLYTGGINPPTAAITNEWLYLTNGLNAIRTWTPYTHNLHMLFCPVGKSPASPCRLSYRIGCRSLRSSRIGNRQRVMYISSFSTPWCIRFLIRWTHLVCRCLTLDWKWNLWMTYTNQKSQLLRCDPHPIPWSLLRSLRSHHIRMPCSESSRLQGFSW